MMLGVIVTPQPAPIRRLENLDCSLTPLVLPWFAQPRTWHTSGKPSTKLD
jgi:hypothetical protein